MLLLFRVTPGVRCVPRLARSLENAWAVAAELAADLNARQSASGVELASALTKIARIAAGRPPDPVPMSRLIGEGTLDARVRRLLAVPEPRRIQTLAWLPALAVLTGTALLLTTSALAGLYEAFELLLR